MAPFSLEAAADEERLMVLEKLEGKKQKSSSPSRTHERSVSPVVPVRSMLDVSSGPIPRHGSIAGIGVGVTAGASGPQSPPIRSMLDITSPIPEAHEQAIQNSISSSPSLSVPSPPHNQRRNSTDSANTVASGLPKVDLSNKKDFVHDHHFDMLPSVGNQGLPKRAAQGGKKTKDGQAPTAMAAAMSGELSSLPGFDRAKEPRHNSIVGIGGKSSSPSSRISTPAQSPGASLPSTSQSTSTMPSNAYVTDSGKVVDMDKAYRKLSGKAFSTHGASVVGVAESPESGRVPKDVIEGEEDEAVGESSDDEIEELSSDEDEWTPEASRGRRRSRRKKGSEGELDEPESGSGSTLGMGQAHGPREVKSQLAAAEAERKTVSSQYPVKSLLEPEISIINPAGEKIPAKKAGVYPNTSFDLPASAATSAGSSDLDGDFSDIKRAQKLSINMSQLDTSIPGRVLRTILRGDWAEMQEEAKDGRRRQRLYLVATDLSDEAAYALEWTIGTILRDGDTMIAMYSIGEETANTKGGDSESRDTVGFGEGIKAAQDTVRSMAALTENTKQYPIVAHNPSTLAPSTYIPATETTSLTGSVDSRQMSKAELERIHAVEDISATCIRLMRKTRLQVRVVVEVIHCKSPKHMVTEAIDELEPTLVILGSRGRSALKGVLLGSFSNYLVTKSSIPVMVARKKLKKHAKMKVPKVRLANNLTTPGSPRRLVTAKID